MFKVVTTLVTGTKDKVGNLHSSITPLLELERTAFNNEQSNHDALRSRKWLRVLGHDDDKYFEFICAY